MCVSKVCLIHEAYSDTLFLAISNVARIAHRSIILIFWSLHYKPNDHIIVGLGKKKSISSSQRQKIRKTFDFSTTIYHINVGGSGLSRVICNYPPSRCFSLLPLQRWAISVWDAKMLKILVHLLVQTQFHYYLITYDTMYWVFLKLRNPYI